MADIELGKRLKNAREQAKMTQQQVCSALNIEKVQTLSAYETGKNSPPIDKLKQLITLYKADTHWILYGEHTSDFFPSITKDIRGFINIVESFSSSYEINELDESSYGGFSFSIIFENPPSFTMGYYQERRFYTVGDFLKKWSKLEKALCDDAIDKDDYETLVKKKISELEMNISEIDFDEAFSGNKIVDNNLPF